MGACAAVAAPVDSGGPIEYPGMKVVVDEQGVQTKGYRFENRCAKPTPWQAEWIWVVGDAPDASWFRKEITLAEAPQRIAAWMTADIKYELYVNGRLVSRGPVDMGRDYAGGDTHRWFYDYRDLTPFFTKGKNVIAAKVFRQWPIGFRVSRGQPGFLFEAEMTVPGQEKLTVKSDGTWRGVPADDGYGWQAPEFDDSIWPPALAVQDIWAPLIPSEIPPLMEARYPVARIEGLPENKVFAKETQSFHEMWGKGDLSHGWCSSPLVQMSARVLGVTPTSPGFMTMAIRPSVCDLTWAKGVVPTPHGDVAVSWTWANDTVQLDVVIPEGAGAEVILPDETKHVKSGRHRFKSSYKRVTAIKAVQEKETLEQSPGGDSRKSK